MDKLDDPYQILGVPRNASASEIRAAYRNLALRHHPDKQSTSKAKEDAHITFTKISNAYELLSDDKARQDCDSRQQQQQQPHRSQQQKQQHLQQNQNQKQQYSSFYEKRFNNPYHVFAREFQEAVGRQQHVYQQQVRRQQEQQQQQPSSDYREPVQNFNDKLNRAFGIQQQQQQQQQQPSSGYHEPVQKFNDKLKNTFGIQQQQQQQQTSSGYHEPVQKFNDELKKAFGIHQQQKQQQQPPSSYHEPVQKFNDDLKKAFGLHQHQQQVPGTHQVAFQQQTVNNPVFASMFGGSRIGQGGMIGGGSVSSNGQGHVDILRQQQEAFQRQLQLMQQGRNNGPSSGTHG